MEMKIAPNFEHHFRFIGLKCRDRITGFEGVGSSVAFDVYGCIQTCITPPHKKGEKEPPTSCWFDNNRLVVVDKKLIQPLPDFLNAPTARDTPGGFAKPAR